MRLKGKYSISGEVVNKIFDNHFYDILLRLIEYN